MYTNNEKQSFWEYLICEMDAIRILKGITHKQIADQLELHRTNISSFFSVRNKPTFEMINKVAKTLEVKLLIEPNEGEFTEEAKSEIKRIALEKMGNVIAKRRSEKITSILK